MSWNLRDDIVRPDGTVSDIDRAMSSYWRNGVPIEAKALAEMEDACRRARRLTRYTAAECWPSVTLRLDASTGLPVA